tara:strand:- start:197 stop:445 length:249 start_codon:yes stop_codon:yes gene_type:complete
MSFFGQEEQSERWVEEGYDFIDSAIEGALLEFFNEFAAEAAFHASGETGIPTPYGGKEELITFCEEMVHDLCKKSKEEIDNE